MLHTKEYYEQKAKTLLAEIRDLEKYVHDDLYNGEELRTQAKVRINLLISDMRRHHISLLEIISLI